MKILSSLRSRIFLASAVLAMLCIGIAIYLVSVRVTREAERTLQREIFGTGAEVDQLRAERTQTYTLMARLIADLPKLKAAVETNDPPTVNDIASGYQAQLNASLVFVTNKGGEILYATGGSPRAAAIAANQPAVREALAGRDSVSLLPQPNGILQVVTVPVALDRPRPEILGTLSAGFLLDDALAAQLKRITGSDIAFGMDGQILAATLPRHHYPALADRLRSSGSSRVVLGSEEFEALPRPLSSAGAPASIGSGPVVLILRSRTEQLRSLRAIHTGLAVTAVLAVLLATVLSFAVASTITRPLAAITHVMREVAATGDLTQKIAVRHGNRWDDEDAQLLATTFNTLTDSIARFQREISHKERLSSLGQLSTVIAHEVRNPLMIIKASLHTLRQPELTGDAMREAVADIDEEVARLNRIVNEVLDFARPIHYELAPVDLNALCRESASAAQASGPGPAIALDLDPAVTTITTDPERLRIALVNMLVNARHAVNGSGARASGASPIPFGRGRPGVSPGNARAQSGAAVDVPHGPAAAPGVADAGHASDPSPAPATAPPREEPQLVTMHTRLSGDRARIVITDRGAGIEPAHLPHVFDPYFTTKRGGTGLGLPIAKNILEGLGGTITVSSVPGRGTEIRVELALNPPSIATEASLPAGRPRPLRGRG
jgi:signal transduction histidine kinase